MARRGVLVALVSVGAVAVVFAELMALVKPQVTAPSSGLPPAAQVLPRAAPDTPTHLVPTNTLSASWLTPYALITGPASTASNTAIAIPLTVPTDYFAPTKTPTVSVAIYAPRPTITNTPDFSGIARPVDQVVLVTLDIPTDSPTPSDTFTATASPTNSDTPTATPTLSRTDIAGTRFANATATRQAYHDALTATASAYLASRTAYYDNVTSTADAIYATRTELANEYAETATTYAENYVPPVPTSNYVAPTNAPNVQPTSAPSGGGGAPPGATAICKDGTYSYAQHRTGACSHHGGVAQWLVNLPP